MMARLKRPWCLFRGYHRMRIVGGLWARDGRAVELQRMCQTCGRQDWIDPHDIRSGLVDVPVWASMSVAILVLMVYLTVVYHCMG